MISPTWTHTISTLRGRPLQTAVVLVFSAAIWIGHIAQVLVMAAALGIHGDAALWLALASRIPIAILAGLIPLTFAGIGTRDVALVVLLGPLILPENAAALGVLFWTRYLVPGCLGLPLLPKFMRLAADLTKRHLQ
jgi:hypothetical protein